MVEREKLASIPLLTKLSAVEIESLAAKMTSRNIKKGSFIVYAEDPGPSILFILSGKVRVTLSSQDGKEVVLSSLSEGEFFGEMSVLTGEHRSANVVAAADCELLILSAEDFHQHIISNTGLLLEVARELALRLRDASTKIADLALYDVYRRLARTLKSLGKSVEQNGQTISIIDERPTHQELASMAGTSREMVTRALKELEDDGCIVIDGKRIEVRRIPN